MDNPISETVKENAQSDTPRTSPPRPARIQRMGQYAIRYSSVLDPRIKGSTWTNVKPEIDEVDRHELFLLADGERKVEMETVTRKLRLLGSQLRTKLSDTHFTEVANAALFTFNKEDHTLANMLRDKLYRMEHVTFAAYKVPHPLFATFQLRIHTDGEITPKAAIIKACGELITELQELDQEFTKEFELKKMAANVPNGGLDI
jgi:DNA-directed RNA polymerase II subunit RPB11